MHEHYKSIQCFILAIQLMSRYLDNGLQRKFFLSAEHDVIYSDLEKEKCSEDSEDGKMLRQLGWHVENGYWAYYT
jgi:hypothetical protein